MIYSELSQLIDHIKKVLEIEDRNYDKDALILYGINYPIMTSNQVDYLVDKIELEININELKEEILKNGPSEKYTSQMEKYIKNLAEIKVHLNESFKADLDDTDDVFLTFKSRKQKKLFKELYLVNSCKRNCAKCCGSKIYDHL